MLARVRDENRKGRFRIPRRGRIRTALLLAALAVAAIVNFRRPHPDKPSAPPKHVAPAVEKPVREKPSKQLKEAAASVKSGAALTDADVEALLRSHPPRFCCSIDTINVNKKRLALQYSLDTALQSRGKELFFRYHPKYAAAVALQPASGRVLVLATYNNPDEIPRALDIHCRSMFPAASIIKIVTTAAAIEKGGLTPQSVLQTSGDNHTLYNSQLAKELKRSREVSFEEAFAYSINPVFGRLGVYLLGAATLEEYLTRFGFNADIPFCLRAEPAKAHVVDSAFALAELASGFNQATVMSPLFGALIAAGVSNDGQMPAPSFVDSIVDLRSGTRLFECRARPWRMPMRPETAAQLRAMMSSVARYGTARNSFLYVKRSGRFADIQYGGKTGNVDMEGTGRVDWFAGFARHASDPLQHIAVCVVSVHGPNWTVHSSFIGAELMRNYVRNVQISQESVNEQPRAAARDSSKRQVPKAQNEL